MKSMTAFVATEVHGRLLNRLEEAVSNALAAQDEIVLKSVRDPEMLLKGTEAWFKVEVMRRILDGMRCALGSVLTLSTPNSKRSVSNRYLGSMIENMRDAAEAQSPVGYSFAESEEELVREIESLTEQVARSYEQMKEHLTEADESDSTIISSFGFEEDPEMMKRALEVTVRVTRWQPLRELVLREIDHGIDITLAVLANNSDSPTDLAFKANQIIGQRLADICGAVCALPEIKKILAGS